MKTYPITLYISCITLLLSVACGRGGSEAARENEQTAVDKTATSGSEALEAQLALGARIYREKCIVCHQPDGKGVEGAFPPLANSDYLQADPVRGVAQTLNGSNEEMTVNGITYHRAMEPQLSEKEEALAVINYVLKQLNGYPAEKLLTMEDIVNIEIKHTTTK
ncbi:MAG: cytochrome c [Bacteroidales bacterium]|nr:cytochrome c [Bacteroidales bacterium]